MTNRNCLYFQFLPEIGYCPQVDSINDLLTGEELLRLVGVLRGIPSNIIQYEINECLKLLGMFSTDQIYTTWTIENMAY